MATGIVRLVTTKNASIGLRTIMFRIIDTQAIIAKQNLRLMELRLRLIK